VLIFYAATTRQLPDFRHFWRAYLIMGLLNNVLPFTMITTAVVNLNASISSILNATTPLFTAVVATLWLKERLTRLQVLGLALGMAGVVILVGWSPLPMTPIVIWSAVLALTGAFFYGLTAVYARRTFVNSPPIKTTTGQLVSSSLIFLPVTIASFPEQAPPAGALFAVAALAVVCTAYAYFLYFQLITSAGATRASMVTFLIPVFSLIWGNILLKEPINSGLLIGLGAILLSLWLVMGMKR
jgi:drug/metabolite transporter (DMT)-like permease